MEDIDNPQGPTSSKQDGRVVLLLHPPQEYPSHLPPSCAILEGVAEADGAFVSDSLRLLFFEESLGCSVVHAWTEWIRDEWIAHT